MLFILLPMLATKFRTPIVRILNLNTLWIALNDIVLVLAEINLPEQSQAVEGH